MSRNVGPEFPASRGPRNETGGQKNKRPVRPTSNGPLKLFRFHLGLRRLLQQTRRFPGCSDSSDGATERNHRPVPQRNRTWLRSSSIGSSYGNDRGGCASGSAGPRGNHGPGSDGSTFRNPNRSTTGRNRRSARKPERHSTSGRRRNRRPVRPRRRWLRSSWVGSSRRPTCDRADRPSHRRSARTSHRGRTRAK